MVVERPTEYGGPLVTITFDNGVTTVERYWYHVPRIGDSVALAGDGLDQYGTPIVVVGRVHAVRWDSDGSVTVIVR